MDKAERERGIPFRWKAVGPGRMSACVNGGYVQYADYASLFREVEELEKDIAEERKACSAVARCGAEWCSERDRLQEEVTRLRYQLKAGTFQTECPMCAELKAERYGLREIVAAAEEFVGDVGRVEQTTGPIGVRFVLPDRRSFDRLCRTVTPKEPTDA